MLIVKRMLPDIEMYIEQVFTPGQHSRAKSFIDSTVMHDGNHVSPRCQRAILVGSYGSIEKLEDLTHLLKIDYRDVIVAGEYDGLILNPAKVRDLTKPFFN